TSASEVHGVASAAAVAAAKDSDPGARGPMMKAILRVYGEAYRGFPREVWMLCAVHFVNRTGSMVLAFLTLYLTKALGYSLGAASQVLAVYGCGYLAGGLVG